MSPIDPIITRFGAIAVYSFTYSRVHCLLVSLLLSHILARYLFLHVGRREWNDIGVRPFLPSYVLLHLDLQQSLYIPRLVQSVPSHCGSSNTNCAKSSPLEEDVHEEFH